MNRGIFGWPAGPARTATDPTQFVASLTSFNTTTATLPGARTVGDLLLILQASSTGGGGSISTSGWSTLVANGGGSGSTALILGAKISDGTESSVSVNAGGDRWANGAILLRNNVAINNIKYGTPTSSTTVPGIADTTLPQGTLLLVRGHINGSAVSDTGWTSWLSAVHPNCVLQISKKDHFGGSVPSATITSSVSWQNAFQLFIPGITASSFV